MRKKACLSWFLIVVACVAFAGYLYLKSNTAKYEAWLRNRDPENTAGMTVSELENWNSFERTDEPLDPRLADAINAFGFKLLDALSTAHSSENIFFSPASIEMALGMAFAGSGGDTRDQIAEAMCYGAMSPAEIGSANAQMQRIWQKPGPKVLISVANSVWCSKGSDFSSQYLKQMKVDFDADLYTADFGNMDTGKAINNWVGDKTNGRITDIVDPSSILGLVCILVDAVYFKAEWVNPFDTTETKEGPFYLASGSNKSMPLMKQYGFFPYSETNMLQAISLDYGKEGGTPYMSMLVFLPKKGNDPHEVVQSLAAGNLKNLITRFNTCEGTLVLPKFRADCEYMLNDALKELGIISAFDPGADFGTMFATPPPDGCWIDHVVHKTFLAIDEKGTEAAAATEIGFSCKEEKEPPQPFEMVVDHPFFLAIVDQRVNTILFIGLIVNPEDY